MTELTTRERFQRMYAHREADRVPMLGSPWGTTLERWRREGLPENVDFSDYFGLDRVVGVGGDNGPQLPSRLIEETDEYVVWLDGWGTTAKTWKHKESTPHWIGRTIVDRDSWEKAKARMVMTRDRIDWDHLQSNYKTWRASGCWIHGGLWIRRHPRTYRWHGAVADHDGR
jgi:uroporphyrinogen decarboxylase